MTRRGGMALAAALFAGGCSSDDGSGDAGTGAGSGGSDAADDGDTMPAEDTTGGSDMQWPPGETAGLGEPCTWHDECVSWYCRRFADAPPDPDAACADTPPFGTVIVTGSVRDLRTREPVGNVDVRVISAFAGVSNPMTADAFGEATADADGRFEVSTTMVNGTPLGIVATIAADGYFLTATALAGPIDESNIYYAGNDIHDMWAVPESDLAAWSQMLADDVLAQPFLPLGELGGSIGIVRDEATGEPIAGAVVQSEKGIDTAAHVRYLNDAADGFNSDATGTSGVFVIINPDLAEEFEAFVGDERLGGNVAGSAPGSVFVIAIQ